MKVCHFVFIFMFVCHSLVWAAKPILLVSPEVLDKITQHYNSLSQSEKKIALNKWVKTLPVKDKTFFEAHAQDLSKMVFPDIKHTDGSLLFEINDKKIKIDSIHKDFGSMKVDGFVLNLLPNNLQKTFRTLQKHFVTKNISFLEMIISSAYAEDSNSALQIYGVIALLLDGHSEINIKNLLSLCDDLKEAISSGEKLDESEQTKIKEGIKGIGMELLELRFSKNCEGSCHMPHSKVKMCLDDIKKDLELRGAHINNSEEKKVVPEAKSLERILPGAIGR